MANELIHIPNDDTQNHPSYVDYNYWLKRLDTQLHELTDQNSIKVPKVVKPKNKTLGTGVINSVLSLPSLVCIFM